MNKSFFEKKMSLLLLNGLRDALLHEKYTLDRSLVVGFILS